MSEKMDTRGLAAFEIIERIARFYRHLDEISDQFYQGEEQQIKDKGYFIGSYKECLVRLFAVLCKNRKKAEKEPFASSYSLYQEITRHLDELHTKYLHHLPRPSEPVELRRFARIIDKQILIRAKKVGEEKANEISIFIAEDIGEQTFKRDPLEEFKREKVVPCEVTFGGQETIESSGEKEPVARVPLHISIPRIDTNNPCRWPALIHEVAHHVMAEIFLEKGILDAFFESLGEQEKIIATRMQVQNQLNLEGWLTETWCDLFACIVTGPAFLFSQNLALFLREQPFSYSDSHPPVSFRLKLIDAMVSHLYPNFSGDFVLDEISGSYMGVVEVMEAQTGEEVDKKNFLHLHHYFRSFFVSHFYHENEERLQGWVEKLARQLTQLDLKVVHELADRLAEGLPIPGYKLGEKENEVPTNIQEILLAGWVFRNSHLFTSVMKTLEEIAPEFQGGDSQIGIRKFENEIVGSFLRFDKLLLKSVQVAEWFGFLYPEKSSIRFKLGEKGEVHPEGASLLADWEIARLLESKELKVIPLMNLDDQIGAVSLDIRLGTAFQYYFPNKHGIVDFTRPFEKDVLKTNSRMVDLDFLESIVLSPGQFVLAQTMEYIRLPENVAAEIEGRSSFARLGLEVHMTAGFIDPGFEGTITLEMFNAGSTPIRLYPGLRIGQLRFMRSNSPLRPYNKKEKSKYSRMLTHNVSLQSKDEEIARFIAASKDVRIS